MRRIKGIRTSKALAAELAEQTRQIRNRIREVLRTESESPARKLFASCRDTMVHDLTEDRFADMSAQTLGYALFAARCSGKPGDPPADSLTDMIPETGRFLHELLSVFFPVRGD